MLRFNKTFFIVSNYLISFLIFLIIFKLRYSDIKFIGVAKRILDFYTILLLLLYSLAIIVLSFSFKLYEINKLTRIKESILSNILISVISMGIFGIYFYFTQTNFARFVFFSGFIIIPVIMSICNKIIFFFINKNKKPVSILYFGSLKNFILFNELINEYKKWFSIKLNKIMMTEKSEKLKMAIKKNNLLVVDTDQSYKKNFWNILNSYEIEGGKIYSLIDMFSYFDQSIPAELINNNHYDLFSSYKIDSFYNRFIKRILDIILSVICLIILSPLILIICISIKITSRGNILFKQPRTTVRDKTFTMYKFRSMVTSDENYDFTIENDSRITLIGKIIRPLRLDEIPQFINILKGDMSLIGPRPERPEVIREITKKYPLFKKRLLIKPGLTGWAQVKFIYVNKIENMNKKLGYDLYYLNNLSLFFDLKILLYTFETILFRRGAM